MQLKNALRILIFTAMKSDKELESIKEISEVYSISQHHLEKLSLN